MRISALPLALLLVIPLLSACEDFTLKRFSVDESIAESTVQGVGLSASLPVVLSSVPLDLKSQDGFDEDKFDFVTEIKLDRAVLTISDISDNPEHDSFEDGNLDNFDFISSLEVIVTAQINDQPRSAVIAFLNADDPQIATSTRTLHLTTTSVDIRDFVEAKGGYELQVTGTGTVPSDDVIFGGNVGFRVGVGFN